jgi:hypothetical protein
MATTPFTAAFVERLTDRTQSYKLRCLLGEIVDFKFYCCADPYDFSITKAPVAILDLDPNTQCTGVNIAWDVSSSWLPLGTLGAGDSYSITWGDGTTTNGNFGGATSGNKNFANAGIYHVELEVTSAAGETGSVEVEVEIVDCANESVLIEQMYALSQTAGPYYRDMEEAAPAWVQRARGLTGNYLVGRDLKLDPHRKDRPASVRHVWIATQAGPAKSRTAMRYWRRLYARLPEPDNAAGDVPAPEKVDLDFYCIAFNPMNEDEVYLLAGTATRAWIYWTVDGGSSWDVWQVRW